MILESEIDDEARPDDHRGDEKDHRSAARRPAKPGPEALGEPQRRIGHEHDERRHPEKVAPEAFEVATAEEASVVIEITGARQVEFGPYGEDDKRQRGEHNVGGKCFVHVSRSDHAVGLAVLGTFDTAAEGAGGAGDWHGIVTAKERPEVRHGFLKHGRAHRVDADAEGISIAAAIANASMAALTMLADEPATIGVCESTPAISVIEPWSLM